MDQNIHGKSKFRVSTFDRSSHATSHQGLDYITNAPAFYRAIETGRIRLTVVSIVMTLCFATIFLQLLKVTALESSAAPNRVDSDVPLKSERAPIIDRNGELLATNLKTVSLFADPRKLINPGEAAHLLVRVFPELDRKKLEKELSGPKTYVWIKRHLTPRQYKTVNELGIPGLKFKSTQKRVYPHGALLSHIVGFTDIDNNGLSGVEKYSDSLLQTNKTPLQLSIDLQFQHATHTELARAIKTFDAVGGTAIVLEANSSEIMAMVSLPDFNPNHPQQANDSLRLNRATLGVYELGSTFKIFNTALALESGHKKINAQFDATKPIKVSGYSIRDYHPKKRWLTIPEIFIYSSNIGSAKMALEIGADMQKRFMEKLGFLSPLSIEIPENGRPLYPKKWRRVNAMTIAFGYGIAITPMHLTNGVAAMVNGGILRRPTLMKREDSVSGKRVISEKNSDIIRRLLRLNILKGSGKKAHIEGYLVGGKTGTAEKNTAERIYNDGAVISSFVAAFPMDEPKYIIYVVLDEPKGNASSAGYATGGWVAAPVARRIISQIAAFDAIPAKNLQKQEILERLSIGLHGEKILPASF